MTKTVQVEFAEARYPVVVGPGAVAEGARRIATLANGSTVFVFIDDSLPHSIVRAVETALADAGIRWDARRVPAGESSKRLDTYAQLCGWLDERGAERTSPVVSVGGGTVGDLAGFVAATYHRGVPFVQVPTTLLAMVDASVGGKVAVNLGTTKNAIGAFHQPEGVFADPTFLTSLDKRQLRSGFAECVKHGVLDGAELFGWTVDNTEAALALDVDVCTELIYRNVAVKAAVVSEDPTERARRALLNLGHTFGHAVEGLDRGKRLTHGEAISIGMAAAAHLSAAIGISTHDLGAMIESALARADLPTRLPFAMDTAALITQMRKDKKRQHTDLQLVLPRALGDVVTHGGIEDAMLAEAWRYVSTSDSDTDGRSRR